MAEDDAEHEDGDERAEESPAEDDEHRDDVIEDDEGAQEGHYAFGKHPLPGLSHRTRDEEVLHTLIHNKLFGSSRPFTPHTGGNNKTFVGSPYAPTRRDTGLPHLALDCDCTFRPMITARSRQLAKTNPGESPWTRLMSPREMSEARKARLEEYRKGECTFSPHISDRSKELAMGENHTRGGINDEEWLAKFSKPRNMREKVTIEGKVGKNPDGSPKWSFNPRKSRAKFEPGQDCQDIQLCTFTPTLNKKKPKYLEGYVRKADRAQTEKTDDDGSNVEKMSDNSLEASDIGSHKLHHGPGTSRTFAKGYGGVSGQVARHARDTRFSISRVGKLSTHPNITSGDGMFEDLHALLHSIQL